MKLVFNKLETPATEIKIAFHGENYKSYNVDEIKTNLEREESTLNNRIEAGGLMVD